jgi:hypothetical protein
VTLNGNANVGYRSPPIPTPFDVYTALEPTSVVDITVYLASEDPNPPVQHAEVQVFVAPLPFPLIPQTTLSFDALGPITQLNAQSFPANPGDLIWVIATARTFEFSQINVQLNLRN